MEKLNRELTVNENGNTLPGDSDLDTLVINCLRYVEYREEHGYNSDPNEENN